MSVKESCVRIRLDEWNPYICYYAVFRCCFVYWSDYGKSQMSMCFGIVGSPITPNYVDNSTSNVSPWCSCSASGNLKDQCTDFLDYFTNNICLSESKLLYCTLSVTVSAVISESRSCDMWKDVACVVWQKQSRSSLYAEYAGCLGPPKHQGASLLSKMF